MIYVDPYGLWGEYVFFFLSGSKNLVGGVTRGDIDDTTVGMSTLALGEYNNPSSAAQAGWYMGTGASMVAGLFYGATALKAGGVVGRAGARLGNKAVSVVKSTSLVEKTTRWASNVLRRVRPAAPAQKLLKAGGKGAEEALRGGADAGRRVLRQKFTADPLAEGAHSVLRRHPVTGKTEKYQTYWSQSNPRNPNPWEKGVRFDGDASPHRHYDKLMEDYIGTPHVHDPKTPGGIRPPLEMEIPR